MKVRRIEVLPHARNPAGDFAVIKLFGISRLERPATYWLEAAAALNPETELGWPTGERKPLGVRAGADSVELLVGPDIVKSAALKPGTEVRFRMPSADIDMLIHWPDLSLTGPTTGIPAEKGLSRLQPRMSGSETAAKPVTIGPAPASVAEQSPPASRKIDTALAEPARVSSRSGWRERVEAEQAAMQSVDRSRSYAWVPMALGLVIVAGLLVTFMRTTTLEGSGVSLMSALRSASVDGNKPADLRSQAGTLLAEILEIGSTSPAGVDASGASQREALERANDILADVKTPEARAEATFWLRKALSRSLSKPRLIWAVTQLGTAYASADKDTKPNFEAARLLWNWAADAGDAQAACFLGRLHELGLGVPPNSKLARDNYERARRLGGCPGLEQAMLRVRT